MDRVRIRLVPLALLAIALTACGQRMGACEGYSEILDRTMCEDHSKDECEEMDRLQAQSARNWVFHEGQTCAGLGYSVTTALGAINMSAEAFEAALRAPTPRPTTPGPAEVGAVR